MAQNQPPTTIKKELRRLMALKALEKAYKIGEMKKGMIHS